MVPARVVVSAETQPGQALHPHSPGCLQYLIPCWLLARDFLCLSFLLGKVGLIFPGHSARSQGQLTHGSTTGYHLMQGCQGSSAIALVDAVGETQVPGPACTQQRLIKGVSTRRRGTWATTGSVCHSLHWPKTTSFYP